MFRPRYADHMFSPSQIWRWSAARPCRWFVQRPDRQTAGRACCQACLTLASSWSTPEYARCSLLSSCARRVPCQTAWLWRPYSPRRRSCGRPLAKCAAEIIPSAADPRSQALLMPGSIHCLDILAAVCPPSTSIRRFARRCRTILNFRAPSPLLSILLVACAGGVCSAMGSSQYGLLTDSVNDLKKTNREGAATLWSKLRGALKVDSSVARSPAGLADFVATWIPALVAGLVAPVKVADVR